MGLFSAGATDPYFPQESQETLRARINLRNDHADLRKCITLLPEVASESEAKDRDDSNPESSRSCSSELEEPAINTILRERLRESPASAHVVCRLCKQYVRQGFRVVLERDAAAIVYHMQAK